MAIFRSSLLIVALWQAPAQDDSVATLWERVRTDSTGEATGTKASSRTGISPEAVQAPTSGTSPSALGFPSNSAGAVPSAKA